MFTLLIKIFIQSRLISNILPIVQQIDCTDLRIIFSFCCRPPFFSSSSFFRGNEADTKESDIRVLEEGRGGQQRKGASSQDEKILRFEAPSAGVYRLHCLVPASCVVRRRNSRYVLTRMYTVRHIVRAW